MQLVRHLVYKNDFLYVCMYVHYAFRQFITWVSQTWLDGRLYHPAQVNYYNYTLCLVSNFEP